MLRQWVIWLVIAGIAHVSASKCDAEDGTLCYETLVHYETLAFPLYGHDEDSLDYTCHKINNSLSCMEWFDDNCVGNDECDDNCTEVVKLISNFLRRAGFPKFGNELCLKGNALRQTYLENVDCLVGNAEKYDACHNASQASQHYMHTTPGALTIEANCCYLSWYRDCFTNVTRDNCGLNATFYVSMASHLIVGQIAEQLCGDSHVFCDKPPMYHDAVDYDDNEVHVEDKPHGSAITINSYVANAIALIHVFVVSKYIL